jgi:2,3-dihydroxybiphenyl 1,2-dioxygenase
MEIEAFGYLGIGTVKLDDWTLLATRGLGMQVVECGAGLRSFRMDDRRQRLVIDKTMAENARYFGWEVANADALDALAARLERAGVAARREPTTLSDQRFVSGLISFSDPSGNRLEAFYGAAVADTPFRPGRMISGFRTGPLGMGHVLIMVQDMTAALAFYRDLLGFRVSDYARAPVNAYFLHVNSRHHSLALVEAPVNGMHHLMVELYSLDDVGQGYDLALMKREQIVATLGRHNNDLMTSFYMHTPSDFLVEYGWGGRDVDDATWQPRELGSVASFWGHDGLFRAVGGEDPPPADLRPDAREQELRAPLQVMDGNFQRLRGVCPWWDSITANQ